MIDLEELEQFIAFDECKTFANIAEKYHISTPSITRNMKHVEEEFGVSLFNRKKNHIELNETGKLAIEESEKLLQNVKQMVQTVQLFDKRQHTIAIQSCAPAPLWKLLRQINDKYPGISIESSICQNEEVLHAWNTRECDIAILPFQQEGAIEYMNENLFVCVPKGHELANFKSLTFEQMNGFNFLLRTELGFWDTMVRNKMPSSRFLVQNDEFTFNELVKSSSLPCFTTDYTKHVFENRVNIPIHNEEAHVTFYLLSKK